MNASLVVAGAASGVRSKPMNRASSPRVPHERSAHLHTGHSGRKLGIRSLSVRNSRCALNQTTQHTSHTTCPASDWRALPWQTSRWVCRWQIVQHSKSAASTTVAMHGRRTARRRSAESQGSRARDTVLVVEGFRRPPTPTPWPPTRGSRLCNIAIFPAPLAQHPLPAMSASTGSHLS